MAKTKRSAKPPELRPRFRIQAGKAIAFGPGKADLLEQIAATGSIGSAASRMGMSYMRAWSLVRDMNKYFREPVVMAARGGSQRGGATLTKTGRQALTAYRRMEQRSLKAARTDWQTLKKLLRA
jgi:molybdate transport system regulatory protein